VRIIEGRCLQFDRLALRRFGAIGVIIKEMLVLAPLLSGVVGLIPRKFGYGRCSIWICAGIIADKLRQPFIQSGFNPWHALDENNILGASASDISEALLELLINFCDFDSLTVLAYYLVEVDLFGKFNSVLARLCLG
jgi:hypothetical protein